MDRHLQLIQSLHGEKQQFYLKRFSQDFMADTSPISAQQKQFLYQRGFTPEKWHLYHLDKNNPEHYLSDVQRWLSKEINGDYANVLNNKVLFGQVFNHFCQTPKVVAVWRSQRLISYGSTWQSIIQGEAPIGLKLVAKPMGGGGGGNIYFLTVGQQSVLIESNDEDRKRKTVRLADLNSIFRQEKVPFIVTEFVQQGQFSEQLFPLTINTIRILVLREPKSGNPHIVRAVQRIGSAESYPIDNFSCGGFSAWIDPETGELGQMVAASGPYMGQRLQHHPDTGESIAGRVIPRWKEILNEIRALFYQLPYLHYCGFDVIVRDEDIIILEGNSFSQVRLFQMHSPLLTDPVYCNLLERHGILI